MSSWSKNIYPNISDVLARKAEGRRQIASLPFAEKLKILEALRDRVEPIRRSRELRENKHAFQSNPVLEAENREGLTEAFGKLGKEVGPRTGPNCRTKADKEWYCLRRYLLTLAAGKSLSYPLRITKSEAPDFVISEGKRDVFGVEVTEATEEDWQRELTKDAVGTDGVALVDLDGYVGKEPERVWSAAVFRALAKKTTRPTQTSEHLRRVDLLIFVNSRSSMLINETEAIDYLLKEITRTTNFQKATTGLSRVSVIGNRKLVYDACNVARVFDLVDG